MSYNKFFLVVALIPLMLSAMYRERVKQVNLVHNWTADPNNQNFVETGSLKIIQDVLKLKQTTLKVTDLSNEKDSNQLSYIVVWNKPAYLKDKTLSKFPQKKAILYMWEPPVVQKNL